MSPVVGIDPDVADLALSAIVLWNEATGGRYEPVVHLGCDGTEAICIREVDGVIARCGGDGAFRGCFDRAAGAIEISEAMFYDQKVSTFAHELGHSLGLEHAPNGLMNNHRSAAERHAPCLDQDTLVSLAAEFPTDSFEFSARCYDDDIRAAALARLDELDAR